jgi:hypothetical protein
MAVLGMDGSARQFRRPPVRLGWGIVCASLLWGLAPGETVVGATERGSPTGILRELGYESVVLRRTEENHWFVFGRVNGRRRSCLVDTGWSFATVSTNTSARLSPARVIERLDLGRVTLTNEPVLVQDMRVDGRPAPYDVVLGCDLLIRHHAILDCANNRLHLRHTAPTLSETRKLEQRLRNAGWVAIELQRHQPPAFTCMAIINDGVAGGFCRSLELSRCQVCVGVEPSIDSISQSNPGCGCGGHQRNGGSGFAAGSTGRPHPPPTEHGGVRP